MLPFMSERFLIRHDSWRCLAGFWSLHGVKVPGGGCHSLSSVLGKVSGQRSSRGWFSGRVNRRAVKARCIRSSRRSAGGSPSSASSAAMGVVLKAPAMFLIAMFCNFWKGASWVFCWFHQTSVPKSATVVMQLWYNCLRADWLKPRSVLPR